MHTPEKLNLWDRLFNRYKQEIYAKGKETWFNYDKITGIIVNNYERDWVEYKIIDRLTGSERIKKEYLN